MPCSPQARQLPREPQPCRFNVLVGSTPSGPPISLPSANPLRNRLPHHLPSNLQTHHRRPRPPKPRNVLRAGLLLQSRPPCTFPAHSPFLFLALHPDTSHETERINRLFALLSARSDINHPVCTECTTLLFSSLSSRLSASLCDAFARQLSERGK
ncbi:autophagy protein [Pseudogymnoascus verrucosus]|uniref:Autophagy protein n=1 Tax=Pseudogymnoascus verrucosus TaxID=342668 RepID=A0A1B8GEU0_9PEZI|nr:autophagy protein [Pseudogymnoascus verrucosus]OBT94337.1 autophagy protein [Pseudogymnoascus verrucosus]